MLGYSCAKCGKELRCVSNEGKLVHFIDNDIEKGVDAIRFGDIYQCPVCGLRVVIGLGDKQFYGYELDKKVTENILNSGVVVEVKR